MGYEGVTFDLETPHWVKCRAMLRATSTSDRGLEWTGIQTEKSHPSPCPNNLNTHHTLKGHLDSGLLCMGEERRSHLFSSLYLDSDGRMPPAFRVSRRGAFTPVSGRWSGASGEEGISTYHLTAPTPVRLTPA